MAGKPAVRILLEYFLVNNKFKVVKCQWAGLLSQICDRVQTDRRNVLEEKLRNMCFMCKRPGQNSSKICCLSGVVYRT